MPLTRLPGADVEVNEPYSWLLGLAAVAVAWGGVWSVVDPGFYVSPDFIAIVAGFVLHELAHKHVARRYGMDSEFVAYGPGLFITFLSGLVPGIVVIAPGYVRTLVYYGAPRKGLLYSVASGPATNILLALTALILAPLLPYPLSIYAAAMVEVNSWLAFFNLLPIPPLDGSKVIRENAALWAAMMAASVALMLAS